jgi:hypothetical protein
MDVFALREKVVSDYKQYIESFVRIRDERIDGFVQEELKKGALWPEAILQLNPAYEPGQRLMSWPLKALSCPRLPGFFGSVMEKSSGFFITRMKRSRLPAAGSLL